MVSPGNHITKPRGSNRKYPVNRSLRRDPPRVFWPRSYVPQILRPDPSYAHKAGLSVFAEWVDLANGLWLGTANCVDPGLQASLRTSWASPWPLPGQVEPRSTVTVRIPLRIYLLLCDAQFSKLCDRQINQQIHSLRRLTGRDLRNFIKDARSGREGVLSAFRTLTSVVLLHEVSSNAHQTICTSATDTL